MLNSVLLVAAPLILSQQMSPIEGVSSNLTALEAMRLCQMVAGDFTNARNFLESEGWAHEPPSDAIAQTWAGETAGWYKRGYDLIVFNSEHGTEDENGERHGSCLAEFRGDSNIAATQIAATTNTAAKSYEQRGKNVLHNFIFEIDDSVVFVSNRADREKSNETLGIMTLAVEPKPN